MKAHQFINVIKESVVENSTKALIDILETPPGRNPNKELIKASTWFNNLSFTEKEQLKWVINQVAEQATFNFLCLLDGVMPIDTKGGTLELNYVDENGTKEIINDEDGDYLHDMLNQK